MSRIKRKGFSGAKALPSISLCRTRIALTTHICARWALKLNTNYWRLYEHELLFFRTRIIRIANEPDGLFSWSLLLEFYLYSVARFVFLKKTQNARDFTNTNLPNRTNEPDGL